MKEKTASIDLLAKAALFEGTFSIDWMLSLTGLKASQVLAVLDAKVKEGVLTEESSGQFRFKKSVEREAFLKSFDHPQREALHRQIVEILRPEIREDSERAMVFSRHYRYVTNDIAGCRWLIRAGDQHAEEVKYQEAIDCYKKAIEDLARIDGQESDSLYIQTVNKYMNLFSVRIDSQWITHILKRALERAEAIDNKAFLSILNMHMAVNQWQQANFQVAKNHFDKGWAIAQSVEDLRLLKSIYTLSAFFYYLQGRFKDTVQEYEKSLQNVDKLPEDTSLLFAVAAIGRSYAAIGQASQGLGMLDAIRKHCHKINQHQVAEWAVMQIGYILKGIGRIDEAQRLLAELDEDASQTYDIRLKEDLVLLRALVFYWKENKETSVAHLKDYLRIVKEHEARGIPTSSYGFMLQICWAMELEKYPKVEDISLQEAINRSISGENTFYKGYGYRYQALLQKQAGEPPETVLRTLERSLQCLEQSGHRLAIARTRIEIARLYLNIGDEEGARSVAKQAANVILSHPELQFPDDLQFLIKDVRLKDNLLEEILKLGQDITTIRNTKDVEKHIILTVIQITGAERGTIFLLKKNGGRTEFVLRAAKNITAEDISRPDFAGSMEVIRAVADTGKGVIRKITRQPNTGSAVVSAYNVRSCVCVPMFIKNEPVGVLYFDNRYLSSTFKESDLKMFTYFAAQAAIAMDNAEAYEEVRRLNQKLNSEKQYYQEKHLESLHADKIIGDSTAIRQVMDKIMQVAETDTTVLITGETGVGKELVAWTIQRTSKRVDKPFIRVNCSTFSESLIASELFGHERGAFTGANEQRAGRFELADGGTLFLDEIGDIPMEVQVRLLRVLQTQEFERVGGNRTLYSDFRLIAATNQDLQKLVKTGRFREDLYYRLNVFPVNVPPLRKRTEDIRTLALYFLDRFSRKLGRHFDPIQTAEMEKLIQYSWPGNVRELENIIERAVIMSNGSTFKVPELKTEAQPTTVINPGLTLAENEKRYILWALEKTDWKISGPGGAAELLDINYGTLRSRMAKHGIRKQSRSTIEIPAVAEESLH